QGDDPPERRAGRGQCVAAELLVQGPAAPGEGPDRTAVPRRQVVVQECVHQGTEVNPSYRTYGSHGTHRSYRRLISRPATGTETASSAAAPLLRRPPRPLRGRPARPSRLPFPPSAWPPPPPSLTTTSAGPPCRSPGSAPRPRHPPAPGRGSGPRVRESSR